MKNMDKWITSRNVQYLSQNIFFSLMHSTGIFAGETFTSHKRRNILAVRRAIGFGKLMRKRIEFKSAKISKKIEFLQQQKNDSN